MVTEMGFVAAATEAIMINFVAAATEVFRIGFDSVAARRGFAGMAATIETIDMGSMAAVRMDFVV